MFQAHLLTTTCTPLRLETLSFLQRLLLAHPPSAFLAFSSSVHGIPKCPVHSVKLYAEQSQIKAAWNPPTPTESPTSSPTSLRKNRMDKSD